MEVVFDQSLLGYLIYFTMSLLGSIYGLYMISKNRLMYVNKAEGIVQIIGVIALLHTTFNRFSHQGYICSGDYASPLDKELSPKLYMLKRGNGLYYTVVAHWLIILGLFAGLLLHKWTERKDVEYNGYNNHRVN